MECVNGVRYPLAGEDKARKRKTAKLRTISQKRALRSAQPSVARRVGTLLALEPFSLLFGICRRRQQFFMPIKNSDDFAVLIKG